MHLQRCTGKGFSLDQDAFVAELIVQRNVEKRKAFTKFSD